MYWKPVRPLPEGLELGAQVDRLVEALPEDVRVAGARGEAEELRRVADVLDHGPIGGARGVEGDRRLPVLDVVAEVDARLSEKGQGNGGRAEEVRGEGARGRAGGGGGRG